MFCVAAYLLGSYLIVITLVAWLVAAAVKHCGIRCVGPRLVGPVLTLLLLPWIPYAVVEFQTAVLGKALREPARRALVQTGWSDEPLRFRAMKILSVRPGRAVVYAVTPDDYNSERNHESRNTGDAVTLVRRGNAWQFEGDWATVWSDSGSADENTFPPYPSGDDYRRKVR